ncbi:hypothetical protein [Kitasatospora sp. P5_F3]
MEKFSVPEQAQSYVDALRDLLQTGVSAAPKLDQSPLIDLPIATLRTGRGASPAVRADEFTRQLEEVVSQELKGKDREGAQLLFGLGHYSGLPARKRYEQVAALFDKTWTWENYRKEPLTRLLFAVYLALWRKGERMKFTPAGPAELALQSDPVDLPVGGDYVLDSYELFYNLPSQPGAPREALTIREIRATRDGVQTWRQSTRWWGEGDEGELPKLVLFGPGELSITHDNRFTHKTEAARLFVAEIKFPKPLTANETTGFAIYRQHGGSAEEIVRKGWHDKVGLDNLVTPTAEASVHIRFPEHARPRHVWHYEDIPDWLKPGVVTDGNMIPIESGYASFGWTSLRLGYCYGIAWEW